MIKDNLELSAARALAVARVLNHNGELNNLSIQGMAETAPIASNDTDAQRARNRRVEITIAQGRAKFAELPALSESQE